MDANVEGWLEVKCPSFYYPKSRTEDCVCGYACDGDKTLTLAFATPPKAGETYRATLRFEIYRGVREAKTVTITVDGK